MNILQYWHNCLVNTSLVTKNFTFVSKYPFKIRSWTSEYFIFNKRTVPLNKYRGQETCTLLLALSQLESSMSLAKCWLLHMTHWWGDELLLYRERWAMLAETGHLLVALWMLYQPLQRDIWNGTETCHVYIELQCI